MWVQKSFQEGKGILYVVATPIGNLEDLSDRTKRILQEVDVIAAEDTRHSKKLLHYLGISTPLLSYHEHNERQRAEHLIKRLEQGDSIALVSDAGMPGISDPGYILVQMATKKQIPVVPIPGPNAALSALACSGLPTDAFLFLGFLPREKKGRRDMIQKWKDFSETMVFYESPHRLEKTLADMWEIWGERQVAIARELTKKHEEWLRGSLSEVKNYIQKYGARGEYTLIIEGNKGLFSKEENHWWEELTPIEQVDEYIRRGYSKKEAIQQTAQDRGIPKREVYQLYHKKI